MFEQNIIYCNVLKEKLALSIITIEQTVRFFYVLLSDMMTFLFTILVLGAKKEDRKTSKCNRHIITKINIICCNNDATNGSHEVSII